ncbi:CLUMA_CG007978, isoform A [Clunio marinus]|uniref:Gustatory receptor n=1 Tax=Clunio marinus TaxID=568069 RepID=A0A1J1I2E1_9DIPT|nr:CLUMA_CG007978, isoform A [Clunio marinus]
MKFYESLKMYSLNSLMSLIFTLIYYNIILSGILLKFLIQLKSWFGVVGFVTYIVESGMSGIFTYGYISYVSLIQDRMWKLNEKLQVIIQKPPEELEKEYETKELLCNEMMRFTKLYKNLCSCVEDINQIYGSSMVLFFAHDFTLLTTQIFGMFYISFFGDPQQLVYKLLALAVWLLPNIIKMTIICFVCHFTRNMIETCGTYIRKFSNEAKEDDLADLVDMFSLQSIHLKTEFSANNFFSIDMSLFFSIISACTTYLVILIQFKNYEDENVDVVLHENFTTTLSGILLIPLSMNVVTKFSNYRFIVLTFQSFVFDKEHAMTALKAQFQRCCRCFVGVTSI